MRDTAAARGAGTRSEDQGRTLLERAVVAVARATAMAERTRTSVARARTLVRGTVLGVDRLTTDNQCLTYALRACSELERAERSLMRLSQEAASAHHVLGGRGGGTPSSLLDTVWNESVAHTHAPEVGSGIDGALAATIRTEALAEATWQLVTETVRLVEDATRPTAGQSRGRRMEANAALCVMRAAGRRADDAAAGTAAASRHLAAAARFRVAGLGIETAAATSVA